MFKIVTLLFSLKNQFSLICQNNVKSSKEREIRLKDLFSRAFVWDLDLHILLTSRLALHNKREFVAYFAKRQEIRVFIKRPR